ncbi:MAG: protein kinase [Planctomycetes bacterium]|nr:protein kinase [Planctomycetota bacterium]
MSDGDATNPTTASTGPSDETVPVPRPDTGPDDPTVHSDGCAISDEQLWSWIDRAAPQLDRHLEQCSECRERAGEYRSQIAQVADGSWKRVTEEGPAPERIGEYRIIREISRGGMGIVYLGEHVDERFRRHVAVKVLKRGMDTEDIVRRFELERQLLASLSHPGIASLFDGGETADGRPYFVLEYIEGLDIALYCDRHRLGITERLKLFEKVCEAVHYAHTNLVVHRDLKPSNILVTADGHPKLLDFGIAKLLDRQMSLVAGDPTAPEIRVMTPEYASPEQVRGDPIRTTSDVYSLGVLLYELVSGHRPYRLKSKVKAELERIICEEDPARPSTAVSKVEQEVETDSTSGTSTYREVTPDSVSQSRTSRPDRLRKNLEGDIDNIVLMAMRKEPLRRYPSAEHLAADIELHLQGLPVKARPATLSYRASKFIRRNRFGVAAAAIVVVSLVGGLVGTSWALGEAVEQKEIAQDERDAADVAQAAEAVQRKRADEERARALEGYEFATGLLYDLGDELQTIEGALPARKILVEGITGYLGGAAEETAADDPLFGGIADGYQRLGSIVGGVRNPNEGEVTEALRLYRKALTIRDRQIAALENPAAAMHAKALVHAYIGDLLIRTSDVGAARTEYRQFLDINRSLVTRDPQSRAYRRHLAAALVEVGDASLDMGLRDEGLRFYQESEGLRLQLAREQYDDPRHARRAQRDVTVVLMRLAGEHGARGDHERALENFLGALELRRTLLQMEPGHSRRLRDVAVANIFVTRELLALDRAAEALPYAEEAGILTRRRHVDNASDVRARTDEAMQLELMGRVRGALDERDEALRLYERALARIEELAREQPTVTPHRERMARIKLRLGEAHAALGAPNVAVRNGREAIAIAQRMVDDDERNVDVQILLAWSLRDLGLWLIAAGDEREAGQRLVEARDLYVKLSDEQPMLEELQQGLDATNRALDDLGG